MCSFQTFCTRTASKVRPVPSAPCSDRSAAGLHALSVCRAVLVALLSLLLQTIRASRAHNCSNTYRHTSAYVSIRQHTSVLLVSVQLKDISVQLRNSLGTAWKHCRIPIGPTPCKPGRVTKLLRKIPRALDGVAGVYKAVDAAAFTLGRT